MFNQLLNKFYTRFFFNIDAILKDELFLMDISATVFKNLRDLLVAEGGQVPTIIAPKTNNKEYTRFLLVRNEAEEADKKI